MPIFNWNQNEGKVFTSALSGATFSVPDEIEVVDRADAVFETYTSNFRNVSEIKKQHDKTSGWSIGIGVFGFHSNKRMATASELMIGAQAELFVVQKFIGVYDVSTWAPQASSIFKNKVAGLNPSSDFTDFFDRFGTHFFSQARYGGELLFYVKVKEDLFKKMSRSEISRQVGAYVSYMCVKLGFSAGLEESQLQFNQSLTQYISSSCEIRPGDAYYADCSQLGGMYAGFVTQVLSSPALLTPTTYPLTDFIATMPGVNAGVVSAMSNALPGYLQSSVSKRTERFPNGDIHAFRVNSVSDKQRRNLEEVAQGAVVPGARYVGMMYDIVADEYRVLPSVQLNYAVSANGQCSTQACGSTANTCMNDPTGNRFAIPNGICGSSGGARGVAKWESYSMHNRSDIEKYYEKTQTKKKFFGISKSSSTIHQYSRRFFQEDLSLAYSKIQTERYTLTLDSLVPIPNSNVPLHPRFVAAVQQLLPSAYDAGAYRRFIQRFGTHYVSEVTLGSRLISQDWFHRCLMYTYSDDFTKKSSGFSLLVVSKKSAEFNQNGHVDAKWAEYSNSLIQYTGGDPFHFAVDKYDSWIGTVPNNPGAVKTGLAPLTDFITAVDATKGANFDRAIQEYINDVSRSESTSDNFFKAQDPKDMPSWCSGYPQV